MFLYDTVLTMHFISDGNINDDFEITNTGNSKVGTIAVASSKTLDKTTTSNYEILVTANDGTFVAHSTISISFLTPSSGAAALCPMFLMIMSMLLILF